MPLATHRVIGIMRRIAVIVVVLLLLPLLITPVVDAAPPRSMKVFSGSLDPGGSTSFTWELNQDVSSFLFHYEVTGGTDAADVIDVFIDETGDTWQLLMGNGWTYCSPGATECPIDTGTYTVTVQSDLAATGPINFRLSFCLVPQPPVDFAGFIPANADASIAISSFGVRVPSPASSTLVLGVAAGSYEFFVDGASEGVVTATQTVTVDLEGGFHLFEVDSTATAEDVRWTVQIQGPPKLEVSIVNPCPILNPEAGQSTCVTGAEATASDGGAPTVTYNWTVTGGSLNSSSSRWVEFTPPIGVASFTLTVNASAPGYLSDTAVQVVQVVPEFPAFFMPLVLTLALALAVLSRRKPKALAK